MKHAVFCLIAAILATLSLLALDDITTGNENNLTLEYVILAVSTTYFLLYIPYVLKHLNRHQRRDSGDGVVRPVEK